MRGSVGADGREGRLPFAGHPPHDLLLVAYPGGQWARKHQQAPEAGAVAGSFNLRQGTEQAEGRGWVAARCSEFAVRPLPVIRKQRHVRLLARLSRVSPSRASHDRAEHGGEHHRFPSATHDSIVCNLSRPAKAICLDH